MKASDLYNPIVKSILKSPLHGMMSGSTMLLTFTGRKSGKQYTTPISYALEGKTVTLISNTRHGWVKNLQGTGTPVTAWVRGEERQGTAQVVKADEPTAVTELEKVYKGIPHAKALELAADTGMLVIKVELN